MTIAIIGCMDRRLNEFFENMREGIIRERPGEDVYLIRDAGGGVKAVEKTIYELGITEIHDYTHTNCGAMKIALSASHKKRSELDEIEGSDDVYDTTVAPFVGEDYATPLDLEQKNTKLQMEELTHLKKVHPDLKISCDMIEIEKLVVPQTAGENVLVIGMAYSGKYSDIAEKYNLELSRIYFVQANNLDEIRPSIKLAVEKLSIHNAFFISNGKAEDRTIESWSNDKTLVDLFKKNLMTVPLNRTQPT
jgi:carbonic anhydrase